LNQADDELEQPREATVLSYFVERMNSLDESEDAHDLAQIDINEVMELDEWSDEASTYPFKNIQSMILHALVNGDHDMMWCGWCGR
jgi:hypothetical protein